MSKLDYNTQTIMVNTKHTMSSAFEEIIFNQQNLGLGTPLGQRRRLITNISPSLLNKLSEKSNKRPYKKTSEERIHEMARKSLQVLFTARTVFPFDFFPDTITITANKIDIVNSNFFASHQTTSIPLRDIANVEIQTSPFFATLTIINIRYPMEPHTLNYLRKKDAIKAKKIIDGLLVVMSHGADISDIDPEKLIDEIEAVGESAVME